MRTHVETTATGILAKRRRDEQSARSALRCRILLGLKRVRKGTDSLPVQRASARGTFAIHRSALSAFAARTPLPRVARPARRCVATDQISRKNTAPLRRDRTDSLGNPVQVIGQAVETMGQCLRREVDHIRAYCAVGLGELSEQAQVVAGLDKGLVGGGRNEVTTRLFDKARVLVLHLSATPFLDTATLQPVGKYSKIE